MQCISPPMNFYSQPLPIQVSCLAHVACDYFMLIVNHSVQARCSSSIQTRSKSCFKACTRKLDWQPPSTCPNALSPCWLLHYPTLTGYTCWRGIGCVVSNSFDESSERLFAGPLILTQVILVAHRMLIARLSSTLAQAATIVTC